MYIVDGNLKMELNSPGFPGSEFFPAPQRNRPSGTVQVQGHWGSRNGSGRQKSKEPQNLGRSSVSDRFFDFSVNFWMFLTDEMSIHPVFPSRNADVFVGTIEKKRNGKTMEMSINRLHAQHLRLVKIVLDLTDIHYII